MQFCSNFFRSIVRWTVTLLFIGSVGIVVSVSRRADHESPIATETVARKEQEISKHAAEARKHLAKVQRLARLAHVRAERAEKEASKRVELEHKRQKRYEKRMEQERRKREREQLKAKKRLLREQRAHRRVIERHMTQVRAALAQAAHHAQQIKHHAATMHPTLVSHAHELTRTIANATLSAQAVRMEKEQREVKGRHVPLQVLPLKPVPSVVLQPLEMVQKHMADVQKHAQRAIEQARVVQERIKAIAKVKGREAEMQRAVEKARVMEDVTVKPAPLVLNGDEVRKRASKKRILGAMPAVGAAEGAASVVLCRPGFNVCLCQGKTLENCIPLLSDALESISKLFPNFVNWVKGDNFLIRFLGGYPQEILINQVVTQIASKFAQKFDITEFTNVKTRGEFDDELAKYLQSLGSSRVQDIANSSLNNFDFSKEADNFFKWGIDERYNSISNSVNYRFYSSKESISKYLSDEIKTVCPSDKVKGTYPEFFEISVEDFQRDFIKGLVTKVTQINHMPAGLRNFFTRENFDDYLTGRFKSIFEGNVEHAPILSLNPEEWFKGMAYRALILPENGEPPGFKNEDLEDVMNKVFGDEHVSTLLYNMGGPGSRCSTCRDFQAKTDRLGEAWKELEPAEKKAVVHAMSTNNTMSLQRFNYQTVEDGLNGICIERLKLDKGTDETSIIEQARSMGYFDDEVSTYVKKAVGKISGFTDVRSILGIGDMNTFVKDFTQDDWKTIFSSTDAESLASNAGRIYLSKLPNAQAQGFINSAATRDLENLTKISSWKLTGDVGTYVEGMLVNKQAVLSGVERIMGLSEGTLKTFLQDNSMSGELSANFVNALSRITKGVVQPEVAQSIVGKYYFSNISAVERENILTSAGNDFAKLGISWDEVISSKFPNLSKTAIPTGENVEDVLIRLGYEDIKKIPTYSNYLNFLRKKGLISQELTAEQKAAIDGYLKRCDGLVGSCGLAVDKDLPAVVQGKALKYSVEGGSYSESQWVERSAQNIIGRFTGGRDTFSVDSIKNRLKGEYGFTQEQADLAETYIKNQVGLARDFSNFEAYWNQSIDAKTIGEFMELYPEFKPVQEMLEQDKFSGLREGNVVDWRIDAGLRSEIAQQSARAAEEFALRETIVDEAALEDGIAARLLGFLFEF